MFPYIDALWGISTGKKSRSFLQEHFSEFSAKLFLSAHNDVEEDLTEVRKLIEQHLQNHKIPLPFRIFQSQLQHFEIDLCKHAIIEDEILLPKVLSLENELLG